MEQELAWSSQSVASERDVAAVAVRVFAAVVVRVFVAAAAGVVGGGVAVAVVAPAGFLSLLT